MVGPVLRFQTARDGRALYAVLSSPPASDLFRSHQYRRDRHCAILSIPQLVCSCAISFHPHYFPFRPPDFLDLIYAMSIVIYKRGNCDKRFRDGRPVPWE